jgi:hypothetical protein
MKKTLILALFTGILFNSLPLMAQEMPVKSKIESVSMFKNGLAVVKHVVIIDKPGQYLLEDLISEPVHGTFWIESDGLVKARTTYKDIDSDQLSRNQMDLQEQFAGQEVELHFKEPSQAPLKGTIEQLISRSQWDQNYNPRGYYDYYASLNRYGQPSPFSGLNLIIRTLEGLNFVDQSSISYLKVLSTKTMVKIRKPVLILQVEQLNKGKATIGIVI